MKSEDLVRWMCQKKVVVILRDVEEIMGLEMIEQLYKSGIKIVEITVECESGLRLLAKACRHFEKERERGDFVIGAGSVLTPDLAQKAIVSQAQFLVSPCYSPEVVRVANENNVTMIAGAFSPTEVYRVWQNGSQFVKIFPAGTLGAGYIKSLLGPLKNVFFFVTGGVLVGDFELYLQAGASLVGIGSELFDKNGSLNQKKLVELTDKMRTLDI